MTSRRFIAALLSVAILHTATADVLEISDKALWIDLVGEFSTIDFTGYADGTFINDQYADLGVIFTDGNDNIFINEAFLNDGAGLDGNQSVNLVLATPQTYFAADFPGDLQIDLYYGDILISTNIFIGGGDRLLLRCYLR